MVARGPGGRSSAAALRLVTAGCDRVWERTPAHGRDTFWFYVVAGTIALPFLVQGWVGRLLVFTVGLAVAVWFRRRELCGTELRLDDAHLVRQTGSRVESVALARLTEVRVTGPRGYDWLLLRDADGSSLFVLNTQAETEAFRHELGRRIRTAGRESAVAEDRRTRRLLGWESD